MEGKKTKACIQDLTEKKKIPYLGVFVRKNHEILFRDYGAIGKRATGQEQLFLYSCTKPMTVVCALRLLEEGKIGLDDEVSKYLPAYANTFLANGNRTKNKMTVRHLFTMSGGLSYKFPQSVKDLVCSSDGKAGTLECVSRFPDDPLLFEPGARFEYSLCHDVLAAVVEVVSGKRFSEYMQEMIFQPLGMEHTGFHLERRVQMENLYLAEKSGNMSEIPTENEFVLGENYDSGGAGAVGCVEDYALFADAMACGGEGKNGYRLLKEETVELMRKEMPDSLYSEQTFTCMQGDGYGYGLGVRTRKTATRWGLPAGEFGWDGAAGAYMMADPVNRISMVIGMHIKAWPNVLQGIHLKLVQCAYEDMKEEGLL